MKIHACNCGVQMMTWIDQTKQKLFDIIKQTKKEAENLKLRVAFVGYVVRSSQTGLAFLARGRLYRVRDRQHLRKMEVCYVRIFFS